MELKQISTGQILANFTQPREKFDKEKIEELASSILSNGLINPIIVREWKSGKYMIVAGERRWRACKLANLKTIQAVVKKYKDDGEWMVESLIENVHREDLGEYEKAKYLKKIMEVKKIKTKRELSKITGISEKRVANLLDLVEPGSSHISKSVQSGEITEHHFRAIKQIEDKREAKQILEKVKKENLSSAQTEKLVPTYKKATPDVKKALLSDEINVEQAERISKLKNVEDRKEAIQEHKNIALVERNVERNAETRITAKQKREFNKKLVQAGTWLANFRGGVTDSSRSLEKTIKILLISTKFILVMDEKQKETFEQQLDRFLEILDKAKQLTEQIEEKL